MKQIFAFENKEEYEKSKDIIESFIEKIQTYQLELENYYSLNDLPKAIVWTSEELATTIFSDVPIPAFTNKDIIYMSPEITKWRNLFVRQLEGRNYSNIIEFYENLSENHILTILGHELTHHSDLFLDDFDDEREDSIWFEEGMCEYLPRKLLLNEGEFEEISNIELELVGLFKDKYGNHSLDDFGSASYQGSLTSIMYDYWRSFLAIKELVEVRTNHDIKKVFEEYHQWHKKGRKLPLTQYFDLDRMFR